ncbi:hypothetical protein EUTSA_v10021894mg [Eutrema salsugineum]|uniref:Uncharacterized protein n=1 Tax=Eutrema salsugineum TaxID=72664 RepID=V4M1B8_EUTSA|nr:hypothetical protein EUTSA_v10021894mg [Eutrema salsugineum]
MVMMLLFLCEGPERTNPLFWFTLLISSLPQVTETMFVFFLAFPIGNFNL